MPELHWPSGCPRVLGVRMVVALIVHRLLCRSGLLRELRSAALFCGSSITNRRR
ncbi:hypothetical protein [Nonomuraea helvata]|uniref:Transposase n=1 Tax=Nonomuraea helvata TaxID=37484 RepID=A0ABV5SAH3_9ACTN